MLKGYIDDSASEDPRVYTLAGYIAPAGRWAAFSDRWQEVLDMSPRLEYFKMSEIGALLSEESKIEKLRLLYGVIEEFASACFSFCVRPEDLTAVYSHPKDHYARHPFYFAADCLTTTVAHNLERLGLPNEQVDYWFDNQAREQMRFLAEANEGKRLVPDSPILKILHNQPNFADEKQVRPLQAADLLAWWERRRYIERLTGAPELPYPWKPTREMPGVRIQYDAEHIRQHHEREITMWRRRGLIPTITYSWVPQPPAWIVRLS